MTSGRGVGHHALDSGRNLFHITWRNISNPNSERPVLHIFTILRE